MQFIVHRCSPRRAIQLLRNGVQPVHRLLRVLQMNSAYQSGIVKNPESYRLGLVIFQSALVILQLLLDDSGFSALEANMRQFWHTMQIVGDHKTSIFRNRIR
ncbi:MAG: hypothetical protein IPK17_35500 [Chloroflexi bacterium]|uniref:hypothetical protein n=1 Tax=Candidatus Flexifilum breve TaxID=3140694 RepID=UPI003134DBB1|nr:hypothetical protein [Chloroflexota bacterium]